MKGLSLSMLIFPIVMIFVVIGLIIVTVDSVLEPISLEPIGVIKDFELANGKCKIITEDRIFAMGEGYCCDELEVGKTLYEAESQILKYKDYMVK